MSVICCDVLVIGVGVVGLMCVFMVGQCGCIVQVIDYVNKVGKKILMFGGGCCNFINIGIILVNFLLVNLYFCKFVLVCYMFGDFIEMVECYGIVYYEKELGQLFCDVLFKQIVCMLVDECQVVGVQICIDCGVDKVECGVDGFYVYIVQGYFYVVLLVVVIGGLLIFSLGVIGFGYELVCQFGYIVLFMCVGLVLLILSGMYQECFYDLSGVVLLVVVCCGDVVFCNFMLIIYCGVSGLVILQIFLFWQFGDDLCLDLLFDCDVEIWLCDMKCDCGVVELCIVLLEVVLCWLVLCLCEYWLLDCLVCQIDECQLCEVVVLLQDFLLVVSGMEGYWIVEVILGGVDMCKVFFSIFELQLVLGLYFIGEVLDVIGWLGGYNF